MGKTLKGREIFKVGKWAASTGPIDVTGDMLDEVVSAYEQLNSVVTGFGIPIKLGHNRRVGEPAYGYAENVRRVGDTLLADFTDVPPEIVDAITQKRYNAVSVEIRSGIKYADQVFPNVLSGVALLGAEWPAVKGLKAISAFSDENEVLTLFQEEEAMPNFTQEQHDTLLAAAVTAAKAEATAATAAQITELTASLQAANARAETAETALGVFAEEKEKADISAIVTAAEQAGKIVPANKAAVLAFAETLRKSIGKAEDRKVAMASFKTFVEALPKKVDLSERAGSGGQRPGDEPLTAQDEVMSKIAKLRSEKKDLSFKDAMAMVFAADEDLKNRYAEENR